MHQYIIYLNRWTSIQQVSDDDSSIPIQKFNFINFDKLMERSFNDLYLMGTYKFYLFLFSKKSYIPFYFVDVIDYITAIESLEPTYVSQKLIQKRNLKIENLRWHISTWILFYLSYVHIKVYKYLYIFKLIKHIFLKGFLGFLLCIWQAEEKPRRRLLLL